MTCKKLKHFFFVLRLALTLGPGTAVANHNTVPFVSGGVESVQLPDNGSLIIVLGPYTERDRFERITRVYPITYSLNGLTMLPFPEDHLTVVIPPAAIRPLSFSNVKAGVADGFLAELPSVLRTEMQQFASNISKSQTNSAAKRQALANLQKILFNGTGFLEGVSVQTYGGQLDLSGGIAQPKFVSFNVQYDNKFVCDRIEQGGFKLLPRRLRKAALNVCKNFGRLSPPPAE